MRILILCTGNSCRSQMAQGFLQSFDPSLEIYSAGTAPEKEVNPFAVRVMREEGIDISHQSPEPVGNYLNETFDFVITVCDNARETCPVFLGKVKERLHIGFEDPATATGSDKKIMQVYRKVRNRIKKEFLNFYNGKIKKVRGGI